MIYDAVAKLIDYGVKKNLITVDDVFVVTNRLMELLCLDEWISDGQSYSGETVEQLLAPLLDYACRQGIINDTPASRDRFDTAIMGVFTPMPREVLQAFRKRYNIASVAATDWYYNLEKNLNYVRAERISRGGHWAYECEYGTLEITINRSKPEKDPRDIALAGNGNSAEYPRCQLCPENAGYPGRADYPARHNLRPVSINVAGERWQFQYSPYGYFREHCIAFNRCHTPMVIDRAVFDKLFDIVEYLPHYFMGSNADLPIVGGSILSHEHFQGGRHIFAMGKATVETEFSIGLYPGVKAGIVKWPVSVIRLSAHDRRELAACCGYILEKWREYSDPSADINAFTGSTPHNTITPVARMRDGIPECDLVLRNNITTPDRPLGLFHPRPEFHHIKKENIGLIEVMGLAILPSRLEEELNALREAMLAGEDISTGELAKHKQWAEKILLDRPEFGKENAQSILEQEVGKVFLEILKDTGVFKRTSEGKAAFRCFAECLK